MSAYFEEEIDGVSGPFYKGTLFPLNRYVFKDPCDNCIVKPMCRTKCVPKLKHHNWLDYKQAKKRNAMNFLSLYDPDQNTKLEMCGIWVATISLISVVLLIIGTMIGVVRIVIT